MRGDVYAAPPPMIYPECPPVGTVLVRPEAPTRADRVAVVVLGVDEVATTAAGVMSWENALDNYGPLQVVHRPSAAVRA